MENNKLVETIVKALDEKKGMELKVLDIHAQTGIADYFIIAAAAYYFVETYIPGEHFESTVPAEVSIHTPITQPAKNVIFSFSLHLALII